MNHSNMAVIQPRLSELPEELVTNISVKLGADDVFSFRLSCKALEQRSFHEFANEYFTQKCFMPTTESLKVLVAIAQSKKLRSYLRHIYIVPVLFSDRVFSCCNGASCVWQPTVRHSEAMRGYIEDQMDLKESGRDLEMLKQAFRQLPTVLSVSFTDSWKGIPASADRCGLSRSMRKIDASLTVLPQHPNDKEYYRWKNHVWKNLLRAIASSNASSLLGFSTDLDHVKNTLTMANLTLDSKTLNGLTKAFRSLNVINLQISSIGQGKISESSDGLDTVKGAQTMQRLAGALSSVRKVMLSFSYSPSSSILCQNFTSNIDLSKLTDFKLDSTFIDAQSLGIMICKMTNIEDLQFRWIDLTEGTWPKILEAILELQKLTHLHLTFLHEAGLAVGFRKPVEQEGRTEGGPVNFTDLFGPGDTLGESDDEDDEDFDDDEDSLDDDEDLDSDGDDDSSDDLPGLASSPGPLPSAISDADMAFESDTDDSMPDLEPQDAPPLAQTTMPATGQTNTSHPVHQTHNGHTASNHAQSIPVDADRDSRGRNICLSGSKEIREQLPIFIKDYNIVEDDEADDLLNAFPIGAGAGGAGGAGGNGAAGGPPGNINAFLNSLGAAIGMGPPTNVTGNAHTGAATFIGPMPPPPPAAAGGGNAGQGGPGGHGHVTFSVAGPYPVAGAQGMFGPPPPPAPTGTNTTAAGGQGGGQANGGASGEDDGEWSDED